MAIFLFFLQLALIPAFYWVGRRIAARDSEPMANLAAAIGALLLVTEPLLRGRPDLQDRFLPEAYIYFEGTWLAIPGALFFAIAAAKLKSRFAGRGMLVLCVLFSVHATWNGIWAFREPGLTKPTEFIRNVCRQSTDYSCGAAAAVTALRENGIESTEAEMASL